MAWAKDCPSFTPKQDALLHQAYYMGYGEDMGYSLSAIAWKESMVGSYIVRVNPTDSGGGSYGVSMIQLETAMWLMGEDNIWRAKAQIVPLLINNDSLALSLGLQKLLAVKMTLGTGWTWKAIWAGYNGSGKAAKAYAEDVAKRVSILQKCIDFH